MPIKDIAGIKYYSLTAIRLSDIIPTNNRRARKWIWRCDCGKEIVAPHGSVKAGDNQSCGCMSRKRFIGNKLPDGEAAFNAVLKFYKYHAEKRGYPFELDTDDVRYITSQNCHYCGKPPSNLSKLRWGDSYAYNGIDRLDNKKGYFIDNVVPCCTECNYSKRDRGYFQFIDWIHKVSNRFVMAGVN